MLRPLGVGYPAIVDEDPFAPIDQAAPDAKKPSSRSDKTRIPLIKNSANPEKLIANHLSTTPATTYVRRTHL
jgi:hypothetical protein